MASPKSSPNTPRTRQRRGEGGSALARTIAIVGVIVAVAIVAVLWKGRIVESGPAEELFDSDNQFVRQFLSGASKGPLGME